MMVEKTTAPFIILTYCISEVTRSSGITIYYCPLRGINRTFEEGNSSELLSMDSQISLSQSNSPYMMSIMEEETDGLVIDDQLNETQSDLLVPMNEREIFQLNGWELQLNGVMCLIPKGKGEPADENASSLTKYYDPFWECMQQHATPIETPNGDTHSQEKLLSLPDANLQDKWLNKGKQPHSK